MIKELVEKFRRDIERITLDQVNIALDIVKYKRHNPTKDCSCETCRIIVEAKEEIRDLLTN